MKLLRNGEVRTFVIGWFVLTILSFLAMIVKSNYVLTILLVYSLLVGALYIVLSFLRYQKIEKLNQYLRELSLGNAKLSFEDLIEGELSILQSELYKLKIGRASCRERV